MRSESEIKELIVALEKDIETIRKNRSNWRDDSVPMDMIKENMHRIHTLQWVLGTHERFD